MSVVSDALSSSRGTAASSALIAVGGGLVAAHFGLSTASASGQMRAAAPIVIAVTAGKNTPMLARGKPAALTMALGKGTYEFLSAAPGDAAKRMKGLLGVDAHDADARNNDNRGCAGRAGCRDARRRPDCGRSDLPGERLRWLPHLGGRRRDRRLRSGPGCEKAEPGQCEVRRHLRRLRRQRSHHARVHAERHRPEHLAAYVYASTHR